MTSVDESSDVAGFFSLNDAASEDKDVNGGVKRNIGKFKVKMFR